MRNKASKRPAPPCYRALLHLFIFILAVAGYSPPLQAASRPGEKITKAVWNIHNKNVTGTAWAIKPHYVILNAHVFKSLIKGEVSRIFLSQKDRSTPIPIERAVRISTTYDLALLKTTERMTCYLPIADGFPTERNEPLYAVGYPEKFFQIAGQSERITFEDHFSYLIPVNKDILPGFSGAPFLNSEGEVVAMLHSSNSNMVSGIKVAYIKEFLEETGRIGVSCGSLPSFMKCFQKGAERTREDANGEGEVSVLARYQLGRPDGYLDATPTHRTKRDWLRLSAQEGFPVAQRQLGKALRRTDSKEAAYWLRRAARAGDPVAKSGLGLINYDQDKARETFEMMKQASEAGYSTAQYNRGLLHFHGWGKAIPRNREKARYWMERAAGNGYSEARKFLRKRFK